MRSERCPDYIKAWCSGYRSWAHLTYFSLITCFNIHLRPHASEPQRQTHHHELEDSPLASSSPTYLAISQNQSLFLYKSLNILTGPRFSISAIFVSVILLLVATVTAPAPLSHKHAIFKVNVPQGSPPQGSPPQGSPPQNGSIVFGSFGYCIQDLLVNGYVSVYIPL